MLATASRTDSRADVLLDAQRQVLEMIVRGGALHEVLAELCRIVEALAAHPVRSGILLADESGETLSHGAAPSLPESYAQAVARLDVTPDGSTCCAAAARREVVITPDLAQDPAWSPFRELTDALGLRAAWALPILSSSGGVLGTFGTYFLEPREPDSHERRLVEVMAHTAALAIERREADRALQATGDRHRFLAELAAATQPLVSAEEIMATTARLLSLHLDVDRCAYAQVEDEKVFVITGDYQRGVPSIVGRWDVAAFGPECARRMLAGEPFVVHDVLASDGISAEHLPAYRATNIQAVICVPLHKEGKFTAAMAVHQSQPRRWRRAEIELVGLVVARCWEALERTRVTRTLQESEARYRAMVEASPECVKLVASDGTLLQMNAAGLAMVEATEREALGSCVYNVIAPEHRERFRAFNERVCQGEGGTLDFEVVGLRGTRRIMETTAVPLPTPGGYAQLAVTRDVTARTRADRALAESRARLDYAVRLSGVGFWYCDLPFDELIWDERVKEHFFLPRHARVTIDLFYERIHPEDREPTRRAIDASIQQHTSYDVVYRTVDPHSGRIKYVRALGGTAYADDGSPKRFDGVTVDVTEQKLDQERLARLLDRERAQARLLERVAQAALAIHASDSLESVLSMAAQEAREIIAAHQAATSLAVGENAEQGIHSVSLSDKYASYRSYAAKPSGNGIYALVAQSNKPMRLSQSELRAHPAWRGLSGEEKSHPPLRGWLAAPLVARDGTNIGLIQLSDKMEGEFSEVDEAILVQLAQIAAVAVENARLYDQLRDQDRRKNEFLATLAHELRNPLAPIRTGLQVLQSGASNAQVDKAHEMMARQLGHMVRMVDDLLDISRVTLGKVTLKRERIDLRNAVHSALETTRPLIESANHRLAILLPERPVHVDADPTRIAQVIANLLNNAAKYTPSGGHIQLEVRTDAEGVLVRVSDTGMGIPRDMIGSVFEMFTQVGRTIERSQGGLGIGLTLVRRLVEMHGGTVNAESGGVGMGTTFTVRLPLLERVSAPHAAQSDGDPALHEPLRILVVDDNHDGAECLAMLLELKGHDTRMAHNGPDAVAEAIAFQPHVVFLDIGLPGFNGYEVAKKLRAERSIPQPYLIALTGWGTDEDRRQAGAAGFDRHLVKPFDTSKLSELLSAVRP